MLWRCALVGAPPERRNFMGRRPPNLIIDIDSADEVGMLTDEQAGQVFKSLLIYQRDGIEPGNLDPISKVVFSVLRKYTDKNNERYEEICRKNKENGAKGGRPLKNPTVYEKTDGFKNNAEKPVGFLENRTVNSETEKNRTVFPETQKTQTKTKTKTKTKIYSAVPLSNINNIYSAREEDESTALPESPQEETKAIVAAWNSCKNTIEVKDIAPCSQRDDNLRLLIKQRGFDEVLQTVKDFDANLYFTQKNKVGFDWFLKPQNFQKVIEGNYKELWTKPKARQENNTFKNFTQRNDDAYTQLERMIYD